PAERLLAKFTVMGKDGIRFKDAPPLVAHAAELDAAEESAELAAYRETLSDDRRALLDKFRVADFAFRMVGVGSVGLVCGMFLLVSAEQDILIVQIKEARPSVLEPYAGKSSYAHCGQRVVNGQRLMQAASDRLLGWTTGSRPPHRHFFLRMLRDVK